MIPAEEIVCTRISGLCIAALLRDPVLYPFCHFQMTIAAMQFPKLSFLLSHSSPQNAALKLVIFGPLRRRVCHTCKSPIHVQFDLEGFPMDQVAKVLGRRSPGWSKSCVVFKIDEDEAFRVHSEGYLI